MVFVRYFSNGTLWLCRWMNVNIITLWLGKKESSLPLNQESVRLTLINQWSSEFSFLLTQVI
jgi:hypothetical protein